ncbi:MAG: 50S ribosomal protein L3 [Parcubacteria group bacterium RIFOXYD2_FULL_52_8]|nr:ribosomal protein L3 [uncultured bacterium]OHB24632.1 MAG: 50S ribosomal protein L3 [Parcubacteria group bacterium RIFOXYD2_FULL_52_8]
MKFLLGTKQYMTQVFDEEGRVHPATVIKAGPVVVTQLKTKEGEGYHAVQVGFGTTKRLAKPQAGHVKELGSPRTLREFRSKEAVAGVQRGQSFDVSQFAPGEIVRISGTSKGKGFQGAVKRHGFKGGPRSHGQKHSERAPGSLGSAGNQRVFPGLRMAGRMGSDRVTLKSVQVLKVDALTNELIIRGAVPGRRGTVLEIEGK